jgi:hypothetical protein
LKGDQHTDHISIEQRVSRHSLPTLLYFLFSPPHIFFNSILLPPANGILAFAPTAQANPSAKAKEPFLPTHRKTITSENRNLRILTISNLIVNKQK